MQTDFETLGLEGRSRALVSACPVIDRKCRGYIPSSRRLHPGGLRPGLFETRPPPRAVGSRGRRPSSLPRDKPFGRYQKRGSGLRAHSCQDEVGEEALLFVGLRNRNLAPVDPIRLGIAGGCAEEQVVGTARRRPSRSCPPRPDCPGACRRSKFEVEHEGGAWPPCGTDAAHDPQVVAVGAPEYSVASDCAPACQTMRRAVELHRLVEDALTGFRGGVDSR